MKLSARNQMKGKIVAVDKGMTTAHVRIDIGGGFDRPVLDRKDQPDAGIDISTL